MTRIRGRHEGRKYFQEAVQPGYLWPLNTIMFQCGIFLHIFLDSKHFDLIN